MDNLTHVLQNSSEFSAEAGRYFKKELSFSLFKHMEEAKIPHAPDTEGNGKERNQTSKLTEEYAGMYARGVIIRHIIEKAFPVYEDNPCNNQQKEACKQELTKHACACLEEKDPDTFKRLKSLSQKEIGNHFKQNPKFLENLAQKAVQKMTIEALNELTTDEPGAGISPGKFFRIKTSVEKEGGDPKGFQEKEVEFRKEYAAITIEKATLAFEETPECWTDEPEDDPHAKLSM